MLTIYIAVSLTDIRLADKAHEAFLKRRLAGCLVQLQHCEIIHLWGRHEYICWNIECLLGTSSRPIATQYKPVDDGHSFAPVVHAEVCVSGCTFNSEMAGEESCSCKYWNF